ncbi:prepilin-type N-terminal cleavage/methylation domain-containing protein [Aquabacterium commune]|uniref:Prepilin-type N-terminal cleavage/methylation domain-containing protein n=1 Tax=Aquabacterium commune TaxID=70586 RepID=A0A4R6R5M2_9BURK|nr:type II secretion system protein [Aquabacterium commune]TDP81024.1 prepilin-type N-terminal cleavage/methylation domain-containing protein [Aquabacterium commune]
MNSIEISGNPRLKMRGFTLIEMVVVVMIVGILASAAMPLMALHKRRTQEAELKESLRTLRRAIDAYKQAADKGDIAKRPDDSGYPPSLDVLVKGVPKLTPGASLAAGKPGEANKPGGSGAAAAAGAAPSAANAASSAFSLNLFGTSTGGATDAATGKAPATIYFLRRLPRDPFADPTVPAAQTWGLRSYASPPNAPAPGADVFDVYSRSEGVGLDGVPLREW